MSPDTNTDDTRVAINTADTRVAIVTGASGGIGRALRPWLDRYNFTRPHGSLSKQPPGSRLTQAPGNYT